MRTLFALVRKFVAFIIAALATFATIFVLLFLSLNDILLDPQTYKQAFTENKVYEQLPAVTAKEYVLIKSHLAEPCAETPIANSCFDSRSNSSQLGEITESGRLGIESTAFINALNQVQWDGLVTNLLTPADVQKSLDAGTDEVIAYFKGETDSAGFPLLDMKARLIGMTDEELTELLLSSQPLCTLEQQTLIMSGQISEAGSSPIFCNATGGTSQVLLLNLQRRLNFFADDLPEQVTIIKSPSPLNPPSLQGMIGEDLQNTLQITQANAQYIPFLPVVFLLLVSIFSVRSLRGLLRWWGIPIFIGSLFALILGIVIFFLFEQIWLNYVLNRFPALLPSGFGDIIYSVALSFSEDVSQHMMTQAAIVTLLALGILLISNRVPAPPDPSLPPLAPPGTPGGPVLNPNRKKKKW